MIQECPIHQLGELLSGQIFICFTHTPGNALWKRLFRINVNNWLAFIADIHKFLPSTHTISVAHTVTELFNTLPLPGPPVHTLHTKLGSRMVTTGMAATHVTLKHNLIKAWAIAWPNGQIGAAAGTGEPRDQWRGREHSSKPHDLMWEQNLWGVHS